MRSVARSIFRAPRFLRRGFAALRPVVHDGLRLDADTRWFLALVHRLGGPPIQTLSPPAARRRSARLHSVVDPPPPAIASVSDSSCPGSGGEIPLRLYHPDPTEVLPALLYLHGGGFVLGSLDSHDVPCRRLARDARCVVVAVDYRLAPEHPYPAAGEDAFAVFHWMAENAGRLGIDPTRIAVGGDSAGGNLAAVLCHRLADAGGPRPCFQLLIYPSTDPTIQTASRDAFASGFFLTREMKAWFNGHYLGETDPHDPGVAPLRRTELAGLPPAHVVTAGFDMLRDEGEAYADRLAEAGVAVTRRRYDGLIHGFLQLIGIADAAEEAMCDIGAVLGEALQGGSSSGGLASIENGSADRSR